jgi:hypothetical protein
VHFGASGARNVDTPFFMLEWAQCGFHKKRIRTRHSKLVFLHSVGYVGDEDINTSDTSTPTHNQISGPITRACACQLNYQVTSFLASNSSYLDNGTCTLFCFLGTTDRKEIELDSRWQHSDSRTAANCDGRPNHVWTWIQACIYFLESSWSLLSYASNLKSI